MDPEEDGIIKDPTGTFTSYVSTVDGVEVPTRLIRADTEGCYWHAKLVDFPARPVRRVRDIYSVLLGGRVVDHGSINEAYYILHTGSSWHGRIGRAEIDVAFAPGVTPTPLQLFPFSAASGNDNAGFAWARHSRNTVLYRGPSKPSVQGRTLTFIRRNFKPAYRDDVLLSFGFRRT